MENDETLKIISQGIRYYKSDLGNNFSLLEYYSFTNVKPKELIKIAHSKKMRSIALDIAKFNDTNFWNQLDLNVEETIRLYHSINSKELGESDKRLILKTLIDEGYPLLDGIYRIAARYYVNFGIDSILKENVRTRVLEKQYENCSNKHCNPTINEKKVLIKQKTLK